MRTTLDLPDDTFRQLKARAALQGMKLKELVAQFIERGLAADSNPPVSPRERPPLPVAIQRDPNAPLTPALTNAELAAILDAQDLEQYQRVLDQSGAAPP
ncbi:hypothetical protein [uncultured Thiocystis sp.]|jgi:hypothetical protein|uniref:hypothetical protein n=1 Tax=uncultured Thiocystis sp. TaxID=1202134 RepID=UPI0025EDBAC7|nr:hypothetical protein [uncultured Thiocystis sp.]